MELESGTEDRQLLSEIKDLLYPKYPFGCNDTIFLSKFQPLFEVIRRFDTMSDTWGDTSITQQVILQIIPLLNSLFTHCPRKQLMVRVLAQISKCKGLLKNLAVGRKVTRISRWSQQLGLQNPILKVYGITQTTLRQLTDSLYQKHRRIPHLQLLFSSFGHLLQQQQKFEEAIKSNQSRVPLDHHYYLAILASATFGCRYIWNRAVKSFINCGGNVEWLTKGVKSAPPILQEMSFYSGLLAYNLRGILLTNPFQTSHGVQNIDRRYKLEALLILSYYQSLSCLALTTGLVSQQDDCESKYLPKSNLQATSYKSFQTVRKCQNLQAAQQQKAAQELGGLFTCQVQQEVILLKKFKNALSLADKKAVSCELIRKIQSVRTLKEQEVELQLVNLKCIQQLKRTFSKFVDFEPLLETFKTKKALTEEEIVLASEWEFQIQGLKFLQLQLGSKVRGTLDRFINQLKVIGDQQGRRILHYYQFYNGYIHQYISYTKLLQQISTAERGYLKLITKSPFLFSEQTFKHMHNELAQRNVDAMDFAMEATASKLELAVTFITLLVDKGYEQQAEN